MISIITTIILTCIAGYNGIGFPRLLYLFIIGMCASGMANWFFRASKMKHEEALTKFCPEEYTTLENYELRAMERGQAKYQYYAREEEQEGEQVIVFCCTTRSGLFKERYIPAEFVRLIPDFESKPYVRFATATKWVWGDIWQSLVPCKFHSVIFELHIPMQRRGGLNNDYEQRKN